MGARGRASSAATNRRLYRVFGLKIREAIELFGISGLADVVNYSL